MSDKVHAIPLGLHKHYKGAFYTVIHLAIESTNARAGRQVVVYTSGEYGSTHTRDADEGCETVTWPDGKKRRRFIPWERRSHEE